MASPDPYPSPVEETILPELNNLERLGAYFTSQIHDINNQIAVLSNSELLLEASQISVSPEMKEFLQRLFSSIHRLSATCDRFNAARKFFPIELTFVPVKEAVVLIAGSVGICPGWSVQAGKLEQAEVVFNPSWISTIVLQLIAGLASNGGMVTLTTEELPARQYQYSLRNRANSEGKAFIIHFSGNRTWNTDESKIERNVNEFQTAMELVRLMGAALSMSLSDDEEDILLGFPLQRG